MCICGITLVNVCDSLGKVWDMLGNVRDTLVNVLDIAVAEDVLSLNSTTRPDTG